MKTMNRRAFVEGSLKATTAMALAGAGILRSESAKAATGLTFSQVPLPYPYAALEPHIDAMTMEIHYSKHHAAYVKNANEAMLAESPKDVNGEKELFGTISRFSAKLRNNAGGVWNHNFFWQCMGPGGGAPSGKLLDALNGSFGSVDKFKEQFSQAAMGRFGSGWAWLVSDGGKLKIGSTPNQDNPMMDVSELKGSPILAIDVWEHAYYLKYQNKRADYVTNWWNVVNWQAAAGRM